MKYSPFTYTEALIYSPSPPLKSRGYHSLFAIGSVWVGNSIAPPDQTMVNGGTKVICFYVRDGLRQGHVHRRCPIGRWPGGAPAGLSGKAILCPAAFFFLRQPEGLGWLTVAALSVKAESNLPSFSPRLVVTDSPYIEGG